MVSYFFGRVMS